MNGTFIFYTIVIIPLPLGRLSSVCLGLGRRFTREPVQNVYGGVNKPGASSRVWGNMAAPTYMTESEMDEAAGIEGSPGIQHAVSHKYDLGRA